MADIDVGYYGPVNNDYSTNTTVLHPQNVANGDGKITYVEIRVSGNNAMSAGTFYGSGSTYTCRDYQSLGTVTSGAKRTISGLDIDVETGDLIGSYSYYNSQIVDDEDTSYDMFYKSGNHLSDGAQSYSTDNNTIPLLYGEGDLVAGGNPPANVGGRACMMAG